MRQWRRGRSAGPAEVSVVRGPLTSAGPARTLRIAVAALGVVLGLGLWGAPAASAHSRLLSSVPAADSTVSALPSVVRLAFNEEIQPQYAVVRVSVGGQVVSSGDPAVAGRDVRQALTPAATGGGTATVAYRVVSADGHPISGSFAFRVSGPADATSPAPAGPVAVTPTATPTSAPTGSVVATPSPAPGDATGSTSPSPVAADDTSGGLPLGAVLVGVVGIGAVAAGVVVARRRSGRTS